MVAERCHSKFSIWKQYSIWKKTIKSISKFQNTFHFKVIYKWQKQPPEVFCKKRCSLKFRKIRRKTPVPEAYNFIKKTPLFLITEHLWTTASNMRWSSGPKQPNNFDFVFKIFIFAFSFYFYALVENCHKFKSNKKEII